MKKRNKVLMILLAVIMLCSVVPVTVFAVEGSYAGGLIGGISSDATVQEPEQNGNVYSIKTASELAWFAEKVNNASGSDFNAILENDIDLGNMEWTPIGTAANPYAGIFDGNGFIIENLNVNSSADYAGLFGFFDNATIKNLTVKGQVSNTNSYTGGIFGLAKNSAIVNCTNYAVISSANSTNGGIGGAAENTNVSGCTNYGNLVSGTYQNGGILGNLNGGTVEKCMNNGTISVLDHAGGIVGWIESGTVENCGNTANVTNTNSFYTYVGGIAGECRGLVQNCFNTGIISGSEGDGCRQAAVVAHYDYNGSGANNYSNINYGNGDSGIVKDDSAFASGEVTWLLNKETVDGVWKQIVEDDNKESVPAFVGKTVYKTETGYANICDHSMNTNELHCADSVECSVCGNMILPTGLHIYTQELAEEKYLKSEADCTNAAVYYKSCINCGASSQGTADEACFAVGTVNEHSFTVLECNETEHWYKCENCDETADNAEHSGGRATCTEKAVCEICNQSYGTANGHSFDTEWNYNNESHWHVCHCGEQSDFAVHTEITVNVKPATENETGYTGDIICSVCGYIIEEGQKIPALPVTTEEPETEEPSDTTESTEATNPTEVTNPTETTVTEETTDVTDTSVSENTTDKETTETEFTTDNSVSEDIAETEESTTALTENQISSENISDADETQSVSPETGTENNNLALLIGITVVLCLVIVFFVYFTSKRRAYK